MTLLLEEVEGLFELLDILPSNLLVEGTSIGLAANPSIVSNQETISGRADKGSNGDTVKEEGNQNQTEDDNDDDKDPEEEEDKGDSWQWLSIEDFFFAFHIDDYEEVFWDMLKRALTNEGDETSASERDLMICFYEHLKDLIDASHDLWQAHKAEQLVTGKQTSTIEN